MNAVKDSLKELFVNWKTVPNLLSFLRILMVPVFAVLYINGEQLWAIFVLFLSGLTDFLDGKIARRFNQISALGKILDPIADKLTQITLSIVLFIAFNGCSDKILRTYSWVFLVFIIKELIMVIGSVIMLSMNIIPTAAEMHGKVATFVFYCIMIAIAAFGAEVGAVSKYYPSLTLSPLLSLILVIISAILTVIALFSYIPGVIQQLKEHKADAKK